MRILIITPTRWPSLTGNAVSVEQIMRPLISKGIEFMVITPEEIDDDRIKAFQPSLVHAFHAYKSRKALWVSQKYGIPLVLNMTGTDYHVDIKKPHKKKVISQMIQSASQVIFFNTESLKKVQYHFSSERNKMTVIYRSLNIMPPCDLDFRKKYGLQKDSFIFAVIGGIRPIKNNLFPIPVFKKLYEQNASVQLIFIGSLRDKIYAEYFQAALDHPVTKYIGPVPWSQMACVYSNIDVVLNTSLSEGDNNVLLESLQFQKPILVNTTVAKVSFENKIPEAVYEAHNTEDLYKKAYQFLTSENFRSLVARKGHQYFQKRLNKHEDLDYLRVYEMVTR